MEGVAEKYGTFQHRWRVSWDKETEVDRFRRTRPLANLVSQCRLTRFSTPPTASLAGLVGPLNEQLPTGVSVIVPECKRMEPVSGSLRKRYDLIQTGP
jgi:hypothetical protein